jgi:C-terminal processing protease CtpA/Prc
MQEQQQRVTTESRLYEQRPAYGGGGSPCGVGMLLGRFDEKGAEKQMSGNLYVLKLVPGGPAHYCGQIQTDDVLLKVDNVAVKGWYTHTHTHTHTQGV